MNRLHDRWPPPDRNALDTTATLDNADRACGAGHHQPVTVGTEVIYGPGLVRRPVGEVYCRHCFAVLEVA